MTKRTSTVVVYCLLIRIQCLCEVYLWGAVREDGSPERGRRGRLELTERWWNFGLLKNEFRSTWNCCTRGQTSVDFIGDEGLSGAEMLLMLGMYEIRWRWNESTQVQQLRGASPLSCSQVICESKPCILFAATQELSKCVDASKYFCLYLQEPIYALDSEILKIHFMNFHIWKSKGNMINHELQTKLMVVVNQTQLLERPSLQNKPYLCEASQLCMRRDVDMLLPCDAGTQLSCFPDSHPITQEISHGKYPKMQVKNHRLCSVALSITSISFLLYQ